MSLISEHFVFMKNLKIINLGCKKANELDNGYFGDDGCDVLFNSSKFLTNLEILNLNGNK